MLRENTRVLKDVQDVTADASIRTTSTPKTSTPKRNPQMDVSRLGRSTYSVPAYSELAYTAHTPLTKRSLPATTSTVSQTKPKKTLRVPVRRRGGHGLDKLDTRGDVHELPFMVNLRDELRMQMWSIRTRYDCARKVFTRHKDLQSLPERQIRGAMDMDTPWEAHKAISSENARCMISSPRKSGKTDTTQYSQDA